MLSFQSRVCWPLVLVIIALKVMANAKQHNKNRSIHFGKDMYTHTYTPALVTNKNGKRK